MNGQEPKFFIKEGCSPELEMLKYMHPALVNMIAWTNHYCWSRGIRPEWTSWMRTKEENKKLNATNVHIYRGADLSCTEENGWNKTKKLDYKTEFSRVFKRLGAYTYGKGGRLVRTPIIEHDNGNGNHFHLQVNPNASIYHTGGINQVFRKINIKEDICE